MMSTKPGKTGALALAVSLSIAGGAGLGAGNPALRLEDFRGLSKAQAKQKFKALPDDATVVRADGRTATKRELVAAAARKPKPDFGALAPGGQTAALAEANAALRAREKARVDASGRAVGAEFGKLRLASTPAPTAVPCPAPKVEGVFPLSNFTPGGSALVKGCGFGSAPGQFVLVLSQSGAEVPLGSLQWSPTGVAGTLPADHPAFKTAPTQPAILKVKQPIGTGTSDFVTYRAPREIRQLPFSKVARNVSTESDDDRCYDWAGGPTGICTHYTGPWDPAGGDKGTDSFTVSLKNGWTLSSWVLKRGAGSTNWFQTSHRDEGKSVAKNDVAWLVLCGDGCHCFYYLDVYVEGEIGTSPY